MNTHENMTQQQRPEDQQQRPEDPPAQLPPLPPGATVQTLSDGRQIIHAPCGTDDGVFPPPPAQLGPGF